ncbi:MAG: tetratricopeptide repeat protein [Acidobacteriota bacterium]|jgi:TPR repeat protein
MKPLFACFTIIASSCCWADIPARKTPAIAAPMAASPAKQEVEAERYFRRGVQFADGDGVAKDMSKAAEYYHKAAEKKHVPAQYSLAYLLENGIGVKQDLKQAAFWYKEAALQGDPQSQNNLGVLYATGSGVTKNDAEAVKWYKLAADQNDTQGLANLAAMYQQGRGVARDYARAYALVSKAAEGGNPVAQNNLALMYANGQGVAKDYIAAYAWLHVAASEIPASALVRDRIAKQLAPDQLARAKQLAAVKLKKLSGAKQ